MNENLISLYNWFDIECDELIQGHEGERVLVSDNTALGYFPDEDSAVAFARKKELKVGNFLVQRCITREQEICYIYHTTNSLLSA